MSQDLILNTSETKIDDELELILREELKTDEQQHFLMNFQLYLIYGKNNKEFVIDLDTVFKWIGFSMKHKAKNNLIKNFEIENDYIIKQIQINENIKGGQNREQILMTVDTFKVFCMTANTEKGKNTRKYYIKLETIIFDYFENKNKNIIKQLSIENKINLQIDKQKTLIKAHQNNPSVYILKISETDEKKFIIKLGETDDISTRIISLRQEYKNCILIDCFPVYRPHKFEQYLLKRPDIKDHRFTSSEMIQISENFTYDNLYKIITNNIDNFNGFTPSQQLQYQFSKEREKMITLVMNENDKIMKQKYQDMLLNLDKIQNINIKVDNNILVDEKTPDSNRRVYKYNKSDLKNPIDTFNSLKEASRSLNNHNLHDYHIRNACLKNILFCDFRWFYVDNSTKLPESIPDTVEEDKKQKKRFGLVAQINEVKDKIINVYPSQTVASNTLNIPTCTITHAITSGIKSRNFYWKMYDDCGIILQETFSGELPIKNRKHTSSKGVQKIDPSTDEIIETYESIQVVCSKYKTSHKTIHTLNNNGNIYRGFKWKILN